MRNHVARWVLLGTVLIATVQVDAQIKVPETWTEVSASGPWVVLVPVGSPQETGWLSEQFDWWGVEPTTNELVFLVNQDELGLLHWLGKSIRLDEVRTRELSLLGRATAGQGGGIPGFSCYRTVEETYQTGQAIAANNPGLASWIDVGDSWAKTVDANDGYDIFVLKLTQSSIPGPKPVFFANFAIHAREYTTAELGTRYAEFLIDGYGTDPNVTWLLDHHEVHLMLQSNPDGRKQAEGGLLWRKNTNNGYCPNTDFRGADLNRNFDFEWGCCNGSSTDPCVTTYRGPEAGSEPEIRTIQDYVRSIFPDQRGPGQNDPAPDDATGVAIDVHSFSELVLWPWGFTGAASANARSFTTLGRKLSFFNNYLPIPISDLTIADGSSADFYYGELGVAGLAFELGTSFFQSCAAFERDIVQQNIAALFYASRVARTPYLTPSGPEALTAQTTPSVVTSGTTVTLSATLDDTRFSNQNGIEPSQVVVSADAFIGAPWMPSAVAIPMTASDGAFDSAIESVQVELDTSGLQVGRHLVFVQGTDAFGQTGLVSAAFLEIVNPVGPELIFADSFETLPVESSK